MRPGRYDSVDADAREMAGFVLVAGLIDDVRTIRAALTREI
jgi:hypothetical protein